MLLALTDHLRCTESHAETWLVARADRAAHGLMIEGVLGCPVCHTERMVRGGVVFWADGGVRANPAAGPDPETSIRLAALLGVTDARAPFVLCGAHGVHSAAIGGMADLTLVLLDPPDDTGAGLATVIRGAPRVPLGERSVQGIALDASHAAADRIDAAVAVLVHGGRMIADAGVPVPAGIKELARDAAQWVGERVATSVPVPLMRAARDTHAT